VVESLDSALARIDPIDLVWLIGGVVFAVFMLAALVLLAASAVRNRRRIERQGSTEQRPTILKTSPPLAPLQPPQRRRRHGA
jgi:hypothetical protein